MASYSSPFLWSLVKICPEITKLWQYLFSEFLHENGLWPGKISQGQPKVLQCKLVHQGSIPLKFHENMSYLIFQRKWMSNDLDLFWSRNNTLCVRSHMWDLRFCPSIYIYKIAQSFFVCPLSPPKRLDAWRRNLACRRVTMLSYTWAGSFVDRGHRLVEN